VVVIEWRTFDQIAADEAIELGKNEFSRPKAETDNPCLCRNRIDQQGSESGA
jgi:hypothetical protein